MPAVLWNDRRHEGRRRKDISEPDQEIVVEAAFRCIGLGPGLLESVYEIILADALRTRGLKVERQKPILIDL